MTPVLPQHPHLNHLKKQAKSLLKAQRSGDPSVCALLRQLHRFAEASDADILTAELSLHEVQFALALDYGFPSWERLQAFVAGEEPLPSPKMDFSAVAFHGDYCRSDSFSMVVTTACSLVDRPVSSELVALLAGNGFAPAIRECEPSRHCWHVQAQGENLDLLARAVGLSVRRLPKIFSRNR